MPFDPASVFLPDVAKRYVGTPRNYRASEVFPGVTADSPRYMDLTLELRERLLKLGVEQPAPDGTFSGTGITDDIYKIGSIPGRPFQPSGVSPTDNSDRIAETSGRYSGGPEFDAFVRLMSPAPGVTPRPVSINKWSVTGAPAMSKDPDRKVHNFLSWIDRGDFRLKNILSGSLSMLAKSDQIMNVWLDGYRYQPDKIRPRPDGTTGPKDRLVYSFEQKWVKPDPTAPEPWKSYDPIFHACRARTVAIINESAVGEKPFAMEWKAHMRDKFPYAFVHTTPEQILAKVKEHALRTGRPVAFACGDVEQHDNNFNMALVYRMYRVMAERVHPVWPALQLMHLRQPQFQKEDRAGGKRTRVVGDPTDISTFLGRGGNRSGNLSTTELATIFGAWYIVHALLLAGEITVDDFEAVMKGTHSKWALLQAGDNFVLIGDADDAWRILDAYPYAGFDRSPTFLGYIFYRYLGEINMVPSIASYVVNRVFPNRSVSDPQKGDPIRGAPLVREHFRKSPGFEAVDAIFVDAVERHLGFTYGKLPLGSEPDLIALDYVQRVLAMNSDAPNYKLDLGDLTEDDVKRLFILVPAERAARVIDIFEGQDRAGWLAFLDFLGRDL